MRKEVGAKDFMNFEDAAAASERARHDSVNENVKGDREVNLQPMWSLVDGSRFFGRCDTRERLRLKLVLL